MRTIGVRCLMVTALLLAAPLAFAAGGIKWQTRLADAQKLAMKTHKVIMVDFYADW